MMRLKLVCWVDILNIECDANCNRNSSDLDSGNIPQISLLWKEMMQSILVNNYFSQFSDTNIFQGNVVTHLR